jgi:5-oxoprolinase (ATP-hydrolysing)
MPKEPNAARPPARSRYRIGLDIGGTFTDFILVDGKTGAVRLHKWLGMPVFNLTLPRAVKALIAKYPPETLQPGDVLITSDPWLCAGQLFDIAVVTPVFVGGALIGLMGTVGHVSDIAQGNRRQRLGEFMAEYGLGFGGTKTLRGGISNPAYDALSATSAWRSPRTWAELRMFSAKSASRSSLGRP